MLGQCYSEKAAWAKGVRYVKSNRKTLSTKGWPFSMWCQQCFSRSTHARMTPYPFFVHLFFLFLLPQNLKLISNTPSMKYRAKLKLVIYMNTNVYVLSVHIYMCVDV